MRITHKNIPLLFQIEDERQLWERDSTFRGIHDNIQNGLGFDCHKQPGDLDNILRSTGEILNSPAVLSTPRVTYVRNSGTFGQFDIVEAQSQSLLINNNDESTCKGEVSSLSNLLPLYSKQLLDRGIIPLTYSAGFHTDPDDPRERGCWSLLRSLNIQLQLVFGDQLNMSFIWGLYLSKIAQGDLPILCRLLEDVMKGVAVAGHEVNVTCIIDGMQFLERDYHECSQVVTRLQNISQRSKLRKEDPGYVFKVLYIHGGVSRFQSIFGLGTWNVPKKRVEQAIRHRDRRVQGQPVDDDEEEEKEEEEDDDDYSSTICGTEKAEEQQTPVTELSGSRVYDNIGPSSVRRLYFGSLRYLPVDKNTVADYALSQSGH